ncbi:MAG: iron-containing alcohol dehydrogenase, partial [Bacilli bacterium]|nr:iron-containing alcohol dehydrogenase [Bacilli bacterium]
MLGDFTYCNPTRLYFGEKALDNLEPELRKYGNNVAFVYGGGSIKKSGLYDQVMAILNKT